MSKQKRCRSLKSWPKEKEFSLKVDKLHSWKFLMWKSKEKLQNCAYRRNGKATPSDQEEMSISFTSFYLLVYVLVYADVEFCNVIVM